MSLPVSLLLKGVAGASTVAVPIALGVIHKDKISALLKGDFQITKEKLGIPDDCDLYTENNTKTCNLTKDKLKEIKFKNVNGGLEETKEASANLKIEKADENLGFPENLKFNFTASGTDINIGSEPNRITLKANTTTEFKIIKENEDWRLEKWTAESLAEKIGFENCTNTPNKECFFKEGKTMNVLDGTNKKINAKIASGTKIKFEEQDGYEYGFKFSVDSVVTLTEGTGANSITELTNSSDTSYEIKIHENKWFLAKKAQK